MFRRIAITQRLGPSLLMERASHVMLLHLENLLHDQLNTIPTHAFRTHDGGRSQHVLEVNGGAPRDVPLECVMLLRRDLLSPGDKLYVGKKSRHERRLSQVEPLSTRDVVRRFTNKVLTRTFPIQFVQHAYLPTIT